MSSGKRTLARLGQEIARSEWQVLPNAEEGAPAVLDYFSILWKFRRTFLLLLLACVGGVLALSLKQRPTYRSTLQLEVQELNQNYLNVRDLDPAGDSSSHAPDSYVQVQGEVLKSEALLSRVIKRLRLNEKESYIAQSVTPVQRIAMKLNAERWLEMLPSRYSETIRGALDLRPPAVDNPEARALRVAAENLKVIVAAQSSVVVLHYTAPDRETPAEFLNVLAEEYLAYTMEARWAGTERTAAWLSKRLGEMRRSLEDSERKLQDYARSFGMLYGNDHESVGEDRLRQLQSEWSKAQVERSALQAKYERIQASPAAQLPQVLEHPILRDYATRLADLQKDYSQLSSNMRPEHPQVRSTQMQIDTLKGLIRTEVENVLGRIKNEYEAANRREALLANSYHAQLQTVQQQAASSVPYHVLKQEVESKRQFYQDMLQKVNSAGVATAIRASNIRVVNPAQVPMLPFRPNLLMNLSIGLGVGVLLATIACFMREATERWSRKLRRPGDASRYLRMPEFGAIPSLEPSQGGLRRWVSERAPLLRLNPSPGMSSRALVDQRTPLIADSFHAALDSLLFSSNDGPAPQVVAISSALPLEGKTTVTSFFGLALGDLSKKVLLIDADFRKPALHHHFHVESTEGLAEFLLNDASDLSNIQSAIVKNVGPGVDLLPAGASLDNAARFLAGDRMQEVVMALRASYDIILIDTPPVLLFPDARILGRQSDGVLLVVRSNQNRFEIYQQAAQLLQQSGNTILGALLNDCSAPADVDVSQYYKRYAGV